MANPLTSSRTATRSLSPTRAAAKQLGLDRSDAGLGSNFAFSDRVRLYLKVLTLINLSFAVAGLLLALAGLAPERDGDASTRVLIVWFTTAVNGLAWFAIARSRHSFLAALLTEGFATLLLATAYTLILLGLDPAPEREQAIVSLLLITVVLVLRSSLIPSPTVATAIIGLMATGIGFGFSAVMVDDHEVAGRIWHGILSLVVVIVTCVTSQTIYGLQRQMRAARRLGQYQLDRRVGRGGMGEVFLATHSLLQRPTAIKLLRDVASTTARDRFRKEVQTASSLTHPNTVEIYDYGSTPDGVFYFAMEYVEGASLEETVAATGPMPAGRAIRVLEQAAGSLSEAHGRGLIHRDVKPSNLMLCERGGDFDTLKVLDFGLVLDVSEADEGEAGGLTGTPYYLAPEAILDERGFVSESDVYALGATGYYLLTGAPPFPRGDLVEVLSDHLATDPVTPDGDDPELVAVIMRCLAKDPADRPADAGAVLVALEACPSHDTWKLEDARIWWAEHREIVEASRGGGDASSGAPKTTTHRS